MLNSIVITSILELSENLFEDNEENRYNKPYNHFLHFFKDKAVLTEHDLVISANFTYGWMPTILNFKSCEFNRAVEIINLAKSQKRLTDIQILLLKSLINNSLVGVSKLLHFINPDVYAIWDSRVCRFLTGMSHRNKVENISLYWQYVDLCNRIASDSFFTSLRDRYKEFKGFNVSDNRLIDQIMFINSDKPLIINHE